MHTYQPLTEKFIVKPSRNIILHQLENEYVSKTYIGLLDMRESKLFLLIICSQNTYRIQAVPSICAYTQLIFFNYSKLSLQNFRQAANPLQQQTSSAFLLCGHGFKTLTNLQSLKGD